MSRPGDQDFLARWSARKLRARAGPALGPEPGPALGPEPGPALATGRPTAAPAAEPDPERADAEILEELGLPDPDSLVGGDDFKAFLGAGIPARLRARALRKLWLSDPVLANLDGLNDYDQDFTDKATVLPDLKTAYRVGKGYLRQPPRTAAAATGGSPPPPPASQTADPPAERSLDATADRQPPQAAPGGDQDSGADAGGAAEADAPAAETTQGAAGRTNPTSRARRMRFRFGGG